MADVLMPRLSDSMEEGVVLQWLKTIGDEVAVGDELVEIETDKANMVYEADSAGTLVEILAAEGVTLPIGAVIARIGEASKLGSNGGGRKEEVEAVESSAASAVPASTTAERLVESEAGGRIKASPLARRLAEGQGLDLRALSGSGSGGRIVKADVEAALASGWAPASRVSALVKEPSAPSPVQEGAEVALQDPETPPSDPELVPARPTPGVSEMPETAKGQVQVVELTNLQQTVARRMAESKATTPHFYLQAEMDMSAALEGRAALRAQTKEGDPVPTFNDMVVKACALALREFPRANGAYRDGKIELYARINVGVAVAAQDALVVPTVFDADRKGLRQISTKEQIFEVLLDRSVAPALELVEKLEMVVAEPEVKLYALAYHDSSSITTRDLNVPLWQLPEAHQERYQSFWEHHKRLRAYYQQLVTEAYEAGTLVAVQPEVGSLVVIGIVEAAPVIARYDDKGVVDMGNVIAASVLRALGSASSKLDLIREDALKLSGLSVGGA